jgi:hypothetical protein
VLILDDEAFLVLMATGASRESEASEITIAVLDGCSSNLVFAVPNPASANLSNQPNAQEIPAQLLVESNDMYSIDINMDLEVPEEVLPAGTCPWPLDLKEVLAIYAALTGAELQVDEDVRQFQVYMRFPKECPAMTQTQARELFEATLREQAAIEVIHPDDKHAIVRFQKPTP